MHFVEGVTLRIWRKKLLAPRPGWTTALGLLGLSQVLAGNAGEGILSLRKSLELEGHTMARAWLAYAYAVYFARFGLSYREWMAAVAKEPEPRMVASAERLRAGLRRIREEMRRRISGTEGGGRR